MIRWHLEFVSLGHSILDIFRQCLLLLRKMKLCEKYLPDFELVLNTWSVNEERFQLFSHLTKFGGSDFLEFLDEVLSPLPAETSLLPESVGTIDRQLQSPRSAN
jgi:hypothetical protein